MGPGKSGPPELRPISFLDGHILSFENFTLSYFQVFAVFLILPNSGRFFKYILFKIKIYKNGQIRDKISWKKGSVGFLKEQSVKS
jgi:hypothetical protein